MLRVALVGCGRIGWKRAKALVGHTLVLAIDTDLGRAQALADEFPACRVSADFTTLAATDIDVVIVSTINNMLAPITKFAIEHGKHVLVEKPAALSAAELAPLVPLARERRVMVKVGFNHRLHPALAKARRLFEEDAVGPLMFIRGRYGHGGRIGYDREWRADPALSGGGELIDQGVHLIDLARWFLGDFTTVQGAVDTFFWDMPVDDNAFLLLRTATGQTAWLHVSCSEWKNMFSLEIYGRTGKLQIDGLGGSYGLERLTYYKMLPEMGPPVTTTWEFPGDDNSWRDEFVHLAECIASDRQPEGNLDDALAVLEVVARVYALQKNEP